MKIAIVTQPLHTNYGGILQNFALQTVLKKMGHEVYTVQTDRYSYMGYGVRSMKHLLKRTLRRPSVAPLPPTHVAIIRLNTNKFIRRHITLTKAHKWIPKNIQSTYGFDAYIVGSDQVWRPIYNRVIEDMYLNFLGDTHVKRIAYAASFGTTNWEYTPEQERACSALLKKFDAVSVRETKGVEFCKTYFGVDAKCVLDPTLLLQKEDYLKLIPTVSNSAPKHLLTVYMLDMTDQKKELIEKIARIKGLTVHSIGASSVQDGIPIAASVESWLQGFQDADFILTDSFHGTVFSILFEKPFLTISNADRGNARFESLLGNLNLRNRLIGTSNFDLDAQLDNTMDYSSIHAILATDRAKSLSFLRDHLK